MRPSLRDWLMLATLGLIWGGAFMATKLAAIAVTPVSLAAVRLVIGAAALLAIMRLRGDRMPGFASAQERQFWVAAACVSVLANALPFTALSWAQQHIDSGLAGVLTTAVPFFLLPLAHVFVPGERMTWRRTFGFLVGFSGVCVLVAPEALASLSGAGEGVFLPAALACLLAAFGYASGSVVAKLAPQFGLLPFAGAALSIAAVLTVPMALAVEDPLSIRPGATAMAAVLYLALVPTALANVMLLEVIRSAGPGFLSNVNYQIPLWAVGLGALALGEKPSADLWLALALVLAGLAIAQVRIGLRRGGHPRA
ncbi:MAG: DMT family transporter [Pseudomonadota bacterium]